ncbi:MAG TPA: hypothetical protein DDW52_25210, partial [Planctomycetaceae bacterium]|nr:hypothetical protein [Planctomycetaceae bacterium]
FVAAETILVSPGAVISTVDGGISLTANADASTSTANANYFSLHLDGATISTLGTGDITLEGTGIYGGSSFSAGLGIEGGTTIESTSQNADAGTITLTGVGADGSQSKHGLISRDTGNSITSAYGDISLNGTGGFRSGANGSNFLGIYLTGLNIASNGTGPDAAKISLDGVGGGEVTTCYGVWLRSDGVSISSVDGDISIVGRGGRASNTSRQTGVLIEDIAYIRSTGAGIDAANITIDGVVGAATAPQTSALTSYGVQISGESTELSTVDGDINIVGSGGDGGVSRNGVSVDAIVSSTGNGPSAGNITIYGQGGTTADGRGVNIGGSWSTVDGDISITGDGTSSPQRGATGVELRGVDHFASTGSGPEAGNITIVGSSPGSLAVLLESSTGSITTVDGDIMLSDTDDRGILVSNFGGFASTGTGPNAGKITLADKRVSIQNLTSGISSVDGDILISSEADEVAGTGLVLNNFGIIESTGTGEYAATITLVGTASDGATFRNGLNISGSTSSNSVIRSVDGNITLTGIAGDRTDPTNRFSENRGINVANVTIETTGAGTDAADVVVSGTGGESGRNGHGVYFVDSSLQTSSGNIMLQGDVPNVSFGHGTYLLRTDVTLSGTGDSAGDLSIAGSSNQISGSVATVDGNYSAIGERSNFSGSFLSTGTGTFNVESSTVGGQAYANGSIESAAGDITVRGGLVSAGGIHSTGAGADAANVLLEGHRVFVTSADVIAVDGGITIASVEDPAESTSSGVFVRKTIRSTGTGADAKGITISSSGTTNSQGVNLQGGSVIETVDADIRITGEGSSDGIDMTSFTSIASTGIGPGAGDIFLEGSGLSHGINADGNNAGIISTIDGNINILGTGSATAGTARSIGLYLREMEIRSQSVSGLGNIHLVGNAGSGTSSNFRGVELDTLDVVVDTGDVHITGTGGNSLLGGNGGTWLVRTAIESTGRGPEAGTITVGGTGGGGSSPHGIYVVQSELTSVDGDIRLIGQGGTLSTSPPSRSESKGLRLSGFNRIESTGYGENAANITIDGTGGNGRSLNSGIEFTAPDSILTTRDGDISLVGIGGAGQSRAIVVDDWAISSTGIGEHAGTISLTGVGSGSQPGIFLESLNINNEYAIESVDGDITLAASGTSTSIQSRIVNSNHGTGNIRSTGIGEHAADILIDGGDGSVRLARDLTIQSQDGEIRLEGVGITVGGSIKSNGSSADDTRDIVFDATGGGSLSDISTLAADVSISFANSLVLKGLIESKLNNGDAGSITVNVVSPTGNGISFDTDGEIVSTIGDIHLAGLASGNGYGIQGPKIKSLGTDKATAATITLVGSGTDEGGSGVLVSAGSAEQPNITTVAGDITILGTGGSGAGSRYRGVYLSNAYIESTGSSKENAGAISIIGTGGTGVSELIGVDIRSSQSDVLSVAGDISVVGTAGTGGGSQNYGLQIRDASVIKSTGADEEAANISLEGISDSNWGVYLNSGRVESAGTGAIIITATGLGDGAVDDLFITGDSVVGGPNSVADIGLNVDSLGMQAPSMIDTWGVTSLQPRTSTTTVALGNGSGNLSLDNTELALFDPGTGAIVIGTEAQPVASIDLAEVTMANTLTIYANNVTDQNGVDFSSIRPVKFGTFASPDGQLQVDGNLFLESGNTLHIDVNGPTPGAISGGYDQIKVRDGFVLAKGTKLETSTSVGYPASENQQFVIVDNDGTDPIAGIFEGLPEGTIVENFLGTPLNARISYLGLDGETGNDVVLTTTNVKNPIYDFSASEYSVPEGDSAAQLYLVSLLRSEETSIASSVDVIFTPGTAESNVDFSATPVTVDFAPGQTSASVVVSVFGERLVEDDETFSLSLSNFSDYGFPGTTNPTTTVTLINDEFAPVAEFSGNFSPQEGTPVVFDASGSSDVEDTNDQLLFEWDLDFAGEFAVDAFGERVEFSRPDGPASQIVALRVTDTEGNSVLTTNQVNTANASPVIIPSSPSTTIKAYNYAELNLPVPIVDPGLLDTHTIEIDYGDGSPIEVIELTDGERGFSLKHLYKVTTGTTINRNVSMTITDSDGASSTRNLVVNVEDLALTRPDNRPTLSISTSDVSLNERDIFRTARIDVRLDRSFGVETFIPIDLSQSTATLDSDYRLSTTLLRFPPFATSVSAFLNTLDDSAYEPNNETVVIGFPETLEVAKVSNRTSDQQFVATILDDGDRRPFVSFASTSGTFQEGEEFELTATLSDVAQEDVTVQLLLAGLDDVSYSDTSIVIPAGQLAGSLTGTITDDELSEPQESFGVRMLNNSQGYPISSRYAFFSGQIKASDAVLVDMNPTWIHVTEGSGQSVQITVTGSEPPEQDVVLPITYSSSTAVFGEDYRGPASIRLEANRPPRATFTIDVLNDQIGEDDELVLIELGETLPNGVQLKDPNVRSRLQIEDDDVAELNFTRSAPTGAEQDGETYRASRTTIWEDSSSFELTVSTGGISFAEDVDIPLTFSRATNGTNYNGSNADLVGPSSSVTLPMGQTSVTFTETPEGDDNYETLERGYLTLGVGDIPGARRGRTSSHEIVIKDNDPLATIDTDAEDLVDEDSGTIDFNVRISEESNRVALIPFKTYGNAEKGVDYEIINETKTNYKVRQNYVEIEPGAKTATIRIRLLDDKNIEFRERIGLWLRPEVGSVEIANANIDGTKFAQVWIEVDERPRPTISQVRGRQPGSSSYSSTSTWINEGGSLRIRVSMPNAADRDVWVPVSFPYASGRAASLGPTRDFTTGGLSNGWLKIPAFKESAYFYLHTVDDLRKEDSEKIRATIGQPVVWSPTKEKWINFGSVGTNYYKFVGIRSSDQDTVYCSSGVKYNSLAIDDGCVVDAFTTSGGPTVANDWTSGSSGSLVIANGYLGSSEVFLDGNFNGRRDFLDLDGDGLRSDD